jgi:hypothetical protein
MIPGSIFTVAGLIGFGACAADTVSVYLLAFVWGLTLFGITIAAISTSSYALDAYRENANEIFIMAMMFKNFFFYGLSNFINNWFAASGPKQVFNVMGGISAALVPSISLETKLTCAVRHFHSDVHVGQEISCFLAQIQCPQDASFGNCSGETSSRLNFWSDSLRLRYKVLS